MNDHNNTNVVKWVTVNILSTFSWWFFYCQLKLQSERLSPPAGSKSNYINTVHMLLASVACSSYWSHSVAMVTPPPPPHPPRFSQGSEPPDWPAANDVVSFTSPARGQKVEGDGTADDLLHVGANDGELHHQPQDDTRHLERAHRCSPPQVIKSTNTQHDMNTLHSQITSFQLVNLKKLFTN